MSQISDHIEHIVKSGPAQLLKARGFRKAARNFRRRDNTTWHIVNVQSSQHNYIDHGKFTLNLGVLMPEVSALLDSPPSAQPVESECTMRVRIGFLMPENLDHWWTVDGTSDLDAIAVHVSSMIEKFGLPWIDKHNTLPLVAHALKDHLSLVSAAAALAIGDTQEAQRRALNLVEQRPRARAHVSQWLLRHGLTLGPRLA